MSILNKFESDIVPFLVIPKSIDEVLLIREFCELWDNNQSTYEHETIKIGEKIVFSNGDHGMRMTHSFKGKREHSRSKSDMINPTMLKDGLSNKSFLQTFEYLKKEGNPKNTRNQALKNIGKVRVSTSSEIERYGYKFYTHTFLELKELTMLKIIFRKVIIREIKRSIHFLPDVLVLSKITTDTIEEYDSSNTEYYKTMYQVSKNSNNINLDKELNLLTEYINAQEDIINSVVIYTNNSLDIYRNTPSRKIMPTSCNADVCCDDLHFVASFNDYGGMLDTKLKLKRRYGCNPTVSRSFYFDKNNLWTTSEPNKGNGDDSSPYSDFTDTSFIHSNFLENGAILNKNANENSGMYTGWEKSMASVNGVNPITWMKMILES